MGEAQKRYYEKRRDANRKAGLRGSGEPRTDRKRISEVRRIAGAAGARATWGDHKAATWRTIRVHGETYDRLSAMRGEKSWDALFSDLADLAGSR